MPVGGRWFVSYRRTYATGIAEINDALAIRGVPTWIDTKNLRNEQTEEEIRRVIQSDETVGALLYLTKDVAVSSVIRKIEIPEILKRKNSNPGFPIIPIIADGLDYKDVAAVLGSDFGADELARWNLNKIDGNPAADVRIIANHVLQEQLLRTREISGALKLRLHARVQPGYDGCAALDLDWSAHFDPRRCPRETWDSKLLTGLNDLSNAVHSQVPNHPWEAEGFLGIPASIALGRAFPTTRGIKMAWAQRSTDAPDTLWSLSAAEEAVDLVTTTSARDVEAEDIAVLVSITDDARPAFDRSLPELPPFRALVSIRADPFSFKLTAGQAVNIVRRTITQLRAARTRYRTNGVVHLFIAGPVGFGFMLGQSLNTFHAVAGYESCEGENPPYQLAAIYGER